jgi:Carboxypeptidase regulatory-like domain/TonB dependent receptor/TonB-dependent Receptor Plug Domain
MKWHGAHILTTTTLALLLAARAFAAAGDPAALTGVAVDDSGAALPGVTVTLKAATPAAEPQEQVTDGTGRFTFGPLGPGVYTVILSLSGFENREFDAVAVPADNEIRAVLELAGYKETVVVRPEKVDGLIPRSVAGESVMEQKVLSAVPLATERVDDALPLLPGVVRGPDGLLNMNGARADQSSFLLNGVSMTDPVTGHFAVRLPVEAIESMNVHGGVYSAALGNATGGVTDLVVRPGQDKLAVEVQNFLPRPRFHDGGLRGVDSFTPRMRVSGPIQSGRMWFSQAVSYRFTRTRVDELPFDESEQKVASFDSVTQVDALLNANNHITSTFVAFPSNIDNAGIDTLHPYKATPDLNQRGWMATVAERAVLSPTMTLATSAAVKQYDMNVRPKQDGVSLVTVSGSRDNYFNTFDRDSQRVEAGSTLALLLGSHLLQTGGSFAHTRYDGIDRSGPVEITRADGSVLRRIDYFGNPVVGAGNTELAGFIEDQWALGARITVNSGLRYAHEQIAGQQTFAPRVAVTVEPFGDSRTVVKAGVGHFADRLPLNAADFAGQQSRRSIDYDADGRVSSTSILVNRVDPDGLKTPISNSWNVELDQQLAKHLVARVGYRQSRGKNDLIVDPKADAGAIQISSTGTSSSDEFEATLRRTLGRAGHITASYVRSSTKADLNDFVSLFGDLRDPVIQPNEYGPQKFDVPNRYLVWGVMNFPRGITVAPTMEYRDGFPYSVVTEEQTIEGARNQGGRFPNLFTLDLAVTKDVQLKGHKAKVGVQFFNLTNHFNPNDVQNNTASPTYGQFANSVDQQIRAKFTLLF